MVALAVVSSGVIFLGCSKENKQPDKASVQVHIGYLPIYVDLPLFVAKENGYFEKRGLDVQLNRFASSPEIGTALINGDIQFGASVAYSVILSTESRDPGKLKVVIVDSETPENYLSSFVALAGSGINTIADLKGKKVGSFPGPEAMTFGKLVLEKYGLNPTNDLQFFSLDSASHLSALQSHTVDALFTYEPIATQAVLEDGAVKILPGAVEKEIINPWQAGLWVISTKFASEHPKEAKQLILALYDAIDYLRKNPQDAKTALAKYTSIKPSVAAATPNIPFAKLGEVDLPAFQRHADILFEQGVVSKKMDANSMLAPLELISN